MYSNPKYLPKTEVPSLEQDLHRNFCSYGARTDPWCGISTHTSLFRPDTSTSAVVPPSGCLGVGFATHRDPRPPATPRRHATDGVVLTHLARRPWCRTPSVRTDRTYSGRPTVLRRGLSGTRGSDKGSTRGPGGLVTPVSLGPSGPPVSTTDANRSPPSH